jgi:hypothetical protein
MLSFGQFDPPEGDIGAFWSFLELFGVFGRHFTLFGAC